MNHALLLAGLLLPWLLGYSWLRPWRGALGIGTAGLLGYGFFLGASLLYLVLLSWHSLIGSISFWPLAAVLAAFATAGLVAGRLLAPDSAHQAATAKARGELDWLTAGLLALVAIHLAVIALELYYRPVYPWDAWQTWMYKAKAWFYAGGPVPLDAPSDWINNGSGNQYNVQANRYPGLVPAMSYWAAVSLGQWSETRVNWPTLLCGLALCLALWEQVRATTSSSRMGAVACLLLISIPLVGAHLSLAGYADLWLAGFGGLGFVALLRGLIQGHPGQCALGLLFLAMGLLAKNDAAVWLACGIALLLVVRYTGFSLLLAGFAALAVLGLALSGVESITLPYLGPLGLHEDALALGPLGSWPLSPQNVFPDYLKHLFLLGSWNLLWYLVLALAVLLLASPRLRELRAPAGWFLFLLVGSQALLFGVTTAGAWARDGTAINRLLLHITPALVFLLVVAVSRWSQVPGTGAPAGTRQLLLAAVSATLLAGTGASFWLINQASGSNIPAKNFSTEDLRAVMGKARVVDDQLQVTQFANGAAILASRPTLLEAGQLQLVELRTHPENREPRELFWRPANAPQALQTRSAEPDETWIDLRHEPRWTGPISEVGVVFYDDSEGKTGVSQLQLHPATAFNLAKLAVDQWQQQEHWSQKSINALRLGPGEPLLPLPVLAGGWVLAGLLVLTLSSRCKPLPAAVATLALAGWLALDLRWLYNSLEQAGATREHYSNTEVPDALDVWGDDVTVRLAERVAEHLGDDPRRVAIAALSDNMRFELLRTKYALLPHAGYVHEGGVSSLPGNNVHAVLILHDMVGDSNGSSPTRIPGKEGWLLPVPDFPGGVLYLPAGDKARL